MKTPTPLLLFLGAVFLFPRHINGELTEDALDDGTAMSVTVLGYSSIYLPTVILTSSALSRNAKPSGGTTTLPLVTPNATKSMGFSTGFSSVTDPDSSGVASTVCKSTSTLLSSTALSLSLTYIRTSSESSAAGVSSVTLPTGLSTSTRSNTTTWSSSRTSSNSYQLSTNYSFSSLMPSRTTLITSTTRTYTNHYSDSSSLGSVIRPSTNGIQPYAWPTSFPKPSGSTLAASKAQKESSNTLEWQLFTPSLQVEARHIDGESQEFTPCTSDDLYMSVSSSQTVVPSIPIFSETGYYVPTTSHVR